MDFEARPVDNHTEAIERAAGCGAFVVTLHPGLTNLPLESLKAGRDSAALVVGFDSSGQPLLLSSSTGVERLVGDLMAAAVWAQYTGIWHRLKVCASEDCRWVFYDRSSNRSGSWCEMEVCGSRAKMRAYRKRRGSTS